MTMIYTRMSEKFVKLYFCSIAQSECFNLQQRSHYVYLLFFRVRIFSGIILLLLLGVSWILGLVSVNYDIEALYYVYTAFSFGQGVFIFLAYVLGDKRVRAIVLDSPECSWNAKILVNWVDFGILSRFTNISVISQLGSRKYPISEIILLRPVLEPPTPCSASQELNHHRSLKDRIPHKMVILTVLKACNWQMPGMAQ